MIDFNQVSKRMKSVVGFHDCWEHDSILSDIIISGLFTELVKS